MPKSFTRRVSVGVVMGSGRSGWELIASINYGFRRGRVFVIRRGLIVDE